MKAIEWQNKHTLVLNEINRYWHWTTFLSEEQKVSASNGGKRLVYLVPSVFPCQEDLARTLAELAFMNHYRAMTDKYSRGAHELVQNIPPQELAELAKTCPIAWEAASLLFVEEIPEIVFVDGSKEKRTRACHQEILKLAKEYMINPSVKPSRKSGPDRIKSTVRNDAIRFAMWMALESGLLATTKKDGVITCSKIVGDIFGESIENVARIWKERAIKKAKIGKNN